MAVHKSVQNRDLHLCDMKYYGIEKLEIDRVSNIVYFIEHETHRQIAPPASWDGWLPHCLLPLFRP